MSLALSLTIAAPLALDVLAALVNRIPLHLFNTQGRTQGIPTA